MRLLGLLICFSSLAVIAVAQSNSHVYTLPPGNSGQLYEWSDTLDGGLAPHSLKVDGALPAGLEASLKDGKLMVSGVPRSATSNPFHFKLTISDSSEPRQVVEQEFEMTVAYQRMKLRGITKAEAEQSSKTNTPVAGNQSSSVISGQNHAATITESRENAAVHNAGDRARRPVASPTEVSTVHSDSRGDWEASGYAGLAIDTFAADEVRRYLNPEESGKIRERAIGGFDFGYRLWGVTNPIATSRLHRRNTAWIYGETVHGVRSADVNCETDPNVPVCRKSLSIPDRLPDQTLFMLRNATSLEAMMGLRWEFLGINQMGAHPANLYVKAQAGFLTIAENGKDVVDVHHLGAGLVMTKSDFKGSYLRAHFSLQPTKASLITAIFHRNFTDAIFLTFC